MTRLLNAQSTADVEHAARILLDGGLVAIPTETVYGLAALGLKPDRVRAIFRAKQRPDHNPVILHVADWQAALGLWRPSQTQDEKKAWDQAEALAQAFWPGPLTLILPKSERVPPEVTAGLAQVAVRVPAHPIAQDLLLRVAQPLAAPSANTASRPSPTTVDHVLKSLDGKIDAVLDGGPCSGGLESTVVDLSGSVPLILRPGALGAREVEKVIGPVKSRSPGQAAHQANASPGQMRRHYAPAIASVRILQDFEIKELWNSDVGLLLRRNLAEALALEMGPRPLHAPTEILLDDPRAYARELFAALYRLEEAGPAMLGVQSPPSGPADDAWQAIRDRLARASSD
jgi:L-threonylcarbamoyladenylate synthase